MDETIYLQAPAVTVTSARIAVNGQTFATRNVGSVKMQDVRRPVWPFLVLLVGLAMLVNSDAWVYGAIVAIAGAVAVWKNPARRRLVLLTGGGEVSAYESADTKFVNALHNAIVNAISAR